MNELIEKLKDKNYVRAFGLMSQEEQKCYKDVGRKNCFMYNGDDWYSADYYRNRLFPAPTDTYAIKPDYQPEPEFVYYEITANADTWLGSQTLNGNWMRLYKLPSLPNFEEFWANGASRAIENIAREVSQGKKVYARFRRDT